VHGKTGADVDKFSSHPTDIAIKNNPFQLTLSIFINTYDQADRRNALGLPPG